MQRAKKRILGIVLVFSSVLTMLPLTVQAEGPRKDISRLTIHYVLDEEQAGPDYEATLQTGKEYSVESPIIQGYLADKEVVAGTLDKDTEVTVTYTETDQEAGYRINYIGRSVEGEETPLETVEKNAPVNSVITAEDKVFDSYVREPGAMSLTVTSDGNAVLNIYYTKTVDPSIIFVTGGSYVAPITAAPGSDISDKIAEVTDPDNAPTLKGYVFDHWDTDLPQEMPEEDMVVNAVWEPGESEYTVVYWKQTSDGQGYEKMEGEDVTRKAVTDSKVNITDEDRLKDKAEDGISDCSTSNGFFGTDYGHADSNVTVTADGQAVLNVYYDRETWKVILYNEEYRENIDISEYTVWKELSGLYGSSIPESELTYEMAKEYYENYYNDGRYFYNGLVGRSQYGFPDKYNLATVGTSAQDRADHLTRYYPGMTANEPTVYNTEIYTETVEADGEFELAQEGMTIHSGKSFVLYTVGTPEGFTWYKGYWKTGDTREEALAAEPLPVYSNTVLSNPQQFTEAEFGQSGKFYIPVWDEASGTYKAKLHGLWRLIYARRICYDVVYMDGDMEVARETDVPYQHTIDLSITPESADGRIFAGWYLMPDLSGEALTEYNMPAQDLILYAKWEDAPCTVNFDTRGGSAVDSQRVEKNSKATEPDDPVREGYTFAGWFDENGVRWSFDREIVEDTTLYAWWTPESTPAPYTVHHRMRGEDTDFYTQTGIGRVGDSVLVQPLEKGDEGYPDSAYMIDRAARNLVLTEGENETVFYYGDPVPADYTVHYYWEGTETSILPDKEVTASPLSFVTEKAAEVEGFILSGGMYGTADLAAGEDEIIFYYKPEAEHQIVVTPADLTVYMGGGEGYEAVFDGSGTTEANSLPDPLFHLITGADTPDVTAFVYTNTETGSSWTAECVNPGSSGVKYYRFVPVEENGEMVRVLYSDGETAVTKDEFDPAAVRELYKEYTISIYNGDTSGNVTALAPGDSTIYQVVSGTGTLRVRAVESTEGGENPVFAAMETEPEGKLPAGSGALTAQEGTSYTLNDTDIPVTGGMPALLFDQIYTSDGTDRETALKEAAARELELNDGVGDYEYECRYLDLVDALNGNAWIKADSKVKVWWGYPEGTDQETEFTLLHFRDLHRDDAAGGRSGFDLEDLAGSRTEQMEINCDEKGISFEIEPGGFSPFVLVWEKTETETPGNPVDNEKCEDGTAPGTGDGDMAFAVIWGSAAVAVLTAAATVNAGRSRRRKR